MSFHDQLAEAAFRDGNTPEQFRDAAQRQANSFWVFVSIGAAVWLLLSWAWAVVPLTFAALFAAQRVSSTITASKLESVHFDLSDVEHVTLIDEIRQKYSALLSDETAPYSQCMFKPSALLPYPRGVIRHALETLLNFVEGRATSPYLDDAIRTPDAAEAIRASLAQLDDFVDVPPAELPTDPQENLRVGHKLGKM